MPNNPIVFRLLNLKNLTLLLFCVAVVVLCGHAAAVCQTKEYIYINGKLVAVERPCSYSLGTTSASFSSSAGNGSISVLSGSGCAWTATSQAAWITITSGSSGTGNGTVNYTVAANTGGARQGTITVQGNTFTVNQAAGCSYQINPTSNSVGSGGGTGSIAVTSGTGCAWTATSQAAWITITSGSSGTGNGTVNYTVAANTGGARQGTITVQGNTFTVNQAASSRSYQINPTFISMPGVAGSASITVTAPPGCAWSATTWAPWITITSGSTGSGNGIVTFTVSENYGYLRFGSIGVASGMVMVMQYPR